LIPDFDGAPADNSTSDTIVAAPLPAAPATMFLRYMRVDIHHPVGRRRDR